MLADTHQWLFVNDDNGNSVIAKGEVGWKTYEEKVRSGDAAAVDFLNRLLPALKKVAVAS